MTDGSGSTLEVREEGEGPVHVLDGRALESGEELEVLLESGEWLAGRYESRSGAHDLEAWLYVPLRVDSDEPDAGRHLEAPLPRHARFRRRSA